MPDPSSGWTRRDISGENGPEYLIVWNGYYVAAKLWEDSQCTAFLTAITVMPAVQEMLAAEPGTPAFWKASRALRVLMGSL